MRYVTLLTLVVLIAHFTLHAEDADEVREKGIAALKDSQTNPRAIVEAARFFVKAAALYGDAGNEEKNVEMNSFLYWCKKKMTLADIEQFTKGGEDAVASKLAAVEKAAPKADDAQKWFDRADQFAKKNPDEHLLIAIRFFEVADRFKGSDASFAAQERSLKEQLSDKNSTVKTVAQPTPSRSTETVVNDVAKRPVPLPDDLKMSENYIKDILKADYAKTDVPGRFVLIAKLLKQADENKNDAASEYVLLHEARDIAVTIGESTRATEAHNRLLNSFKIDRAAAMIDLRKLEPLAKTAEPASALAALFSLEADNAFAAGDYENAVRFHARVEDLLPLIKDAALKTRLKEEIPRVQAIRRESVTALAAQKSVGDQARRSRRQSHRREIRVAARRFGKEHADAGKRQRRRVERSCHSRIGPAERGHRPSTIGGRLVRSGGERNVRLSKMQDTGPRGVLVCVSAAWFVWVVEIESRDADQNVATGEYQHGGGTGCQFPRYCAQIPSGKSGCGKGNNSRSWRRN